MKNCYSYLVSECIFQECLFIPKTSHLGSPLAWVEKHNQFPSDFRKTLLEAQIQSFPGNVLPLESGNTIPKSIGLQPNADGLPWFTKCPKIDTWKKRSSF